MILLTAGTERINMNPFLVITPDKDTIDLIYKIRKELVEKQFGIVDSRAKVLPHITLTYIEEELTKEKIEAVINSLIKMDLPKSFQINVKEIVNWDQKIVAMFDPSALNQLVENFKLVFKGLSIKANSNYEGLYGKTIGDHMKIAREVKLEKIPIALELIQNTFPNKFNLETVAFIDYDCEEKDILWKKSLEQGKI